MSCCGSRRAALRTSRSELAQTVQSNVAATAAAAPDRMVAVRYAHDGDIVVRGDATGRVYRFAAGAAMEIAAADARALVGGGQFGLDDGGGQGGHPA